MVGNGRPGLFVFVSLAFQVSARTVFLAGLGSQHHKGNNSNMRNRNDIDYILDECEQSAEYRRTWMKGLPAQLGTFVRVALAARAMVHCITWHERNGGLPDDAPRLHEAKQVFEDMSLRFACLANGADLNMFDECVDLIDDLGHGPECPICVGEADLWMFRDRSVWDMISA